MIRGQVRYMDGQTIFCILLILFVINLIGCSQIESKSRQDSKSQISVKETEGTILVNKYMAHISKGEIQEADKFLSTKNTREIINNSNLGTNDGVGLDLPWSSILYEKNLVLTKIVDEKTEGETTRVYALLGDSKTPDVNISATFYLEKADGNLLIKDIKLTPGKTN